MLGYKECLDFLDHHHISYKKVEHEAVYTIDEVNQVEFTGKEKCVKNLFLRDDKKRHYYLVAVEPTKTVNLKNLQQMIQSRRLSFASVDDLHKYLGVDKGAVTPLGIFNNIDRNVIVIFDKDIIGEIGVHPMINTCSLFLDSDCLKKLIINEGYDLIEVKL